MDHENKDHIEVNLCKSMSFCTKHADPLAILQDPFIEANWDYIVALSKEKKAVNLLCKTDGFWDKSTWSATDYEPFVLNIICSICIHSSHRQWCENYLKLCGLLALTRVSEVGRTCCAIINCTINWQFNPWALSVVNSQQLENGEDQVGFRERRSLLFTLILSTTTSKYATEALQWRLMV